MENITKICVHCAARRISGAGCTQKGRTMKVFHLKKTRSRVHHTRRHPLYALLALLLIACVTLTILWVKMAGARRQVALARQNLAAGVQTELNAAIRAFEKHELPTADLKGDIIPTMRIRLHAARTGNRIMQDSYREFIVEEQTLDQIEDAVDQVDRMLALGQNTSPAIGVLGSCLDQMEADLTLRFADTGLFVSRTALK